MHRPHRCPRRSFLEHQGALERVRTFRQRTPKNFGASADRWWARAGRAVVVAVGGGCVGDGGGDDSEYIAAALPAPPALKTKKGFGKSAHV